MASIGDISGVSSSTKFNVKLSEKQEDQAEKVIGTLLQSVEDSPQPNSREGHGTGASVDVVA